MDSSLRGVFSSKYEARVNRGGGCGIAVGVVEELGGHDIDRRAGGERRLSAEHQVVEARSQI